MKKFAIVVVTYNRPNSLRRLLKSLRQANYDGDSIDLVISIDKSENKLIDNIAEEVSWEFGEKIIKTYPKRLGLREHILKCGELFSDYENLIVLEDDIYVSKQFYTYSKQSVKYYKDNVNIAGISLYTHQWDQNSNRYFQPIEDTYDTFFMQYASSWGQIWMSDSWKKFKKWYDNNQDEFDSGNHIPQNIANWPKSSWLKYHIKYCIEKNKFFVYPKIGLATNFSDIGQHVALSSSGYQIPILEGEYKVYKFAEFNSNSLKYDAFFENIELGKTLNIESEELCIDLYGMKRNRENKRYLLTLESLDFKVINSFGYSLRPHDLNILHEVPGKQIKLYDTYIKETNNDKEKISLIKCRYDIKNVDKNILLRLAISEYIDAIKRLITSKKA